MTRTVFTTLTDRASGHLTEAANMLSEGEASATVRAELHELEFLITQHADLTDALVHLGRTIRGKRDSVHDRGTERLLQKLAEHARRRSWTASAVPSGAIVNELVAAARCTRAAADLWTTHRSASGRPRSPEASQMGHPSMVGAALRHWRHLVGQSSSVAAAIARLHESEESGAKLGILAGYPTPSRLRSTLQPVQVPLARPTVAPHADPLTAIDERVDRIHRHIWDVAQEQRMTAAVLVNAAAIGMLLARAAGNAEVQARMSAGPGSGQASPERRGVDSTGPLTEGELGRWAGVAAAMAPLRTIDAPTTVLQVERLDLARLLERALALARPMPADVSSTAPEVAERLWEACVTFRPVAAQCAASVRALHQQGQLYLAGRQLPGYVFTRRPDLVSARLTDQLVPAPTMVARRLEAHLHAIASAQPSAGSAA